MNVNFMKVHQPNMPAPGVRAQIAVEVASTPTSVVENDTRIGRILDKVRALGLDKNTYVSGRPTTALGRTSIPTPATRRSAAPKAPCAKAATAFRRSPGARAIKAGSKNPDIVGGLDYMATFASLAGVKLPENDRDGQPIIFDSYDMSPVLFGTGKSSARPGSTSPRTN